MSILNAETLRLPSMAFEAGRDWWLLQGDDRVGWTLFLMLCWGSLRVSQDSASPLGA